MKRLRSGQDEASIDRAKRPKEKDVSGVPFVPPARALYRGTNASREKEAARVELGDLNSKLSVHLVQGKPCKAGESKDKGRGPANRILAKIIEIGLRRDEELEKSRVNQHGSRKEERRDAVNVHESIESLARWRRATEWTQIFRRHFCQ